MTWFRIYFQQPRSAHAWREKYRPVLADGEVARDQILARKRPKAIYTEVARVHACSGCGQSWPWDEGWRWFGSWQDVEDGKDVTVFCSRPCADEHGFAGQRGNPYEPSRTDGDFKRWEALRAAREAIGSHRKVPMPDWPGPGSCRWCLEPTIWEAGKRAGQPAPTRNWHNACYHQYELHTATAAQFDFLFTQDGPRCQNCGDGGYAAGTEIVIRPEGMSWAEFYQADKTDLSRMTILKPAITLEVDHIIPLWEAAEFGGSLDERRRWFGPENIWLLCVPCHKKKSRLEAARRAAVKRST